MVDGMGWIDRWTHQKKIQIYILDPFSPPKQKSRFTELTYLSCSFRFLYLRSDGIAAYDVWKFYGVVLRVE